MLPIRSPKVPRLLVAVAISVALHSLGGLAWLTLGERSRPLAVAEGTDVEGPDDRQFTINLREVTVATPRVTPTPPDPPPSPPPMFPQATRHSSDIRPVGATTQGPSPEPPRSLPESVSGTPLHGKLKAGKSIVYVLDRSSSMGTDGQLRKACAAIKASLCQLPADCRFQIVAYNGGVARLASELLPATDENRLRAERWLDGLIAEGSSNHRVGIQEALWLRPDGIFFLTDADDLDEREVKAISSLMREPVYLTATVFGGERRAQESPLERLTKETGGGMRYVHR
jgi:hypothetical protein